MGEASKIQPAQLALFFLFVLFLEKAPHITLPSFFSSGEGIASWYGRSDAGIRFRTADGEIFNDARDTCASWDFPFGTYLKITDIASGKSVICRVNDRGPQNSLGRAVDLTKTCFSKIADPAAGLIRVRIMPLSGPQETPLPKTS